MGGRGWRFQIAIWKVCFAPCVGGWSQVREMVSEAVSGPDIALAATHSLASHTTTTPLVVGSPHAPSS